MNYTVTAVKGSHDWDGDHGPMRDYLLEVDGADKAVELTQKRETKAPTVGQVLDVELGPHPRFQERLKAKKVQKQAGGGGWKPKTPQETASIEMQSVIKSAAVVFSALPEDKRSFDVLDSTIDRLFQKVQAAKAAA